MRIVATPMCAEILKLAGVSDFIVNKNPDSVSADIAVVLRETKTKVKSIKIKLNTFSQIEESIKMISEIFETEPPESLNYYMEKIIGEKIKIKNSRKSKKNQKIKVKVYSNFLKDIVYDMGFNVVNENYDHVVYPDYMKNEINKNKEARKNKNTNKSIKLIEVPSHNKTPINPFKRAKLRYKVLEKEICMKP